MSHDKTFVTELLTHFHRSPLVTFHTVSIMDSGLLYKGVLYYMFYCTSKNYLFNRKLTKSTSEMLPIHSVKRFIVLQGVCNKIIVRYEWRKSNSLGNEALWNTIYKLLISFIVLSPQSLQEYISINVSQTVHLITLGLLLCWPLDCPSIDQWFRLICEYSKNKLPAKFNCNAVHFNTCNPHYFYYIMIWVFRNIDLYLKAFIRFNKKLRIQLSWILKIHQTLSC